MLAKLPVLSRSRSRTRSKRAGIMGVYSSQAGTILQRAGDSCDKVAETLQVRGIQGVRNAVRLLNPIVRLLQKSLPPGILMDLMNPESLRITLPDGAKEEAAVPQAVVDFLDAFNEGRYPALEMVIERE